METDKGFYIENILKDSKLTTLSGKPLPKDSYVELQSDDLQNEGRKSDSLNPSSTVASTILNTSHTMYSIINDQKAYNGKKNKFGK